LRSVAAASGCRGIEAEICLVEATALHAMHADEAARERVHRALAVTTPDQFVRLFADEGRPISTLLRQVDGELRRGEYQEVPYREFVPRLLTMLIRSQGASPAAPTPSGAAVPPVEPLTEREREIIRLIARGCSNQEVARELFLGVSTVKWHLLNIYGKLQVQSRTQAVAHARELGLV
jgi:LuxR family maltose regulon positive regulatory protein